MSGCAREVRGETPVSEGGRTFSFLGKSVGEMYALRGRKGQLVNALQGVFVYSRPVKLGHLGQIVNNLVGAGPP